MGKVVGFPIGDRHVGVERIARKIYLATKDYERQKAMAFQRAENMLERATDAGVPEDVAFDAGYPASRHDRLVDRRN